MKIIKNKKVLVIPDIHQCVGWVEGILNKEFDCDHVVFLGDYFDCFESPDNKWYFSMANTCAWINKTFEKLGSKATWLLGNHDYSYISTFKKSGYFEEKSYHICSGWTGNKANSFNRIIEPKWIEKLDLCCWVDDICLSHAGFHPTHFRPFETPFSATKRLSEEWDNTRLIFKHQTYHFLSFVGKCRGGKFDVGSPIWLDWNQEFEPIKDMKQLVGHTDRMDSVSVIEGNFCIDVHRKAYAVINNGVVNIRYFSRP
jgi:hypothetical protein